MSVNSHVGRQARRVAWLAIVAVVAVALHGCISINANGYERLSAAQRLRVVHPNRPLDELTLSDTIYVVDDNDVRDFLKDKDLAIVCCYLTWCTGNYCVSPDLILNGLEKTQLPFVMIAGDFNSLDGYNAPYPFITIDSQHYNTGNYSRSIKRMFQALGCGDAWHHKYHLFSHGELGGYGMTLDEAMQSIKEP